MMFIFFCLWAYGLQAMTGRYEPITCLECCVDQETRKRGDHAHTHSAMRVKDEAKQDKTPLSQCF